MQIKHYKYKILKKIFNYIIYDKNKIKNNYCIIPYQKEQIKMNLNYALYYKN